MMEGRVAASRRRGRGACDVPLGTLCRAKPSVWRIPVALCFQLARLRRAQKNNFFVPVYQLVLVSPALLDARDTAALRPWERMWPSRRGLFRPICARERIVCGSHTADQTGPALLALNDATFGTGVASAGAAIDLLREGL